MSVLQVISTICIFTVLLGLIAFIIMLCLSKLKKRNSLCEILFVMCMILGGPLVWAWIACCIFMYRKEKRGE